MPSGASQRTEPATSSSIISPSHSVIYCEDSQPANQPTSMRPERWFRIQGKVSFLRVSSQKTVAFSWPRGAWNECCHSMSYEWLCRAPMDRDSPDSRITTSPLYWPWKKCYFISPLHCALVLSSQGSCICFHPLKVNEKFQDRTWVVFYSQLNWSPSEFGRSI